MVDGLCVTPAPQVLQCPHDYVTVCKNKDRSESPCCAKEETAEKAARCRDGTDSHDGRCTRILARERVHECPPGHALMSSHGTQCIKQEYGEAAPACVYPDELSPEGDSCLTTIQQGFEYICPDEYECVARSLKKKKKYSPLCSACVKIEKAQPTCGCPEGQDEFNGFCYEAGTYEFCQSRKGLPQKQAPPRKKGYTAVELYDQQPEVNCKPLGHVTCTCDLPFSLQGSGESSTCIHRDLIPAVPICRGQTDENGNCIAQVQKRVLYECAEGFTCDVVNKKGRCNCVRLTAVEPTKRCASGEEREDKCIEIIEEPKILECPQGYSETCCDNICTCTKTTLAVREIHCAPGAVSIQGDCAYVSKPSTSCEGVSTSLRFALSCLKKT